MSAWGAAEQGVFARKRKRAGACELLSHELITFDHATQTSRSAFHSRPELLNPMGQVQGGVLAAMLDEAMIDVLIIATDYGFYIPTLELKVSYLRPARPGRFEAEGRIVRKGRTTAFLEGSLFDGGGTLVATSSSTCKMMPEGPAPTTGGKKSAGA